MNLATAWHRLAKFCQAAGTAVARSRGSKARNAEEADEQDLQVEAPDFRRQMTENHFDLKYSKGI